MRSSLRACGLAAALLLVACATTPTDDGAAASGSVLVDLGPGADQPLVGSSARLAVHGMSCPKCVSNVDITLKRLPGVTSAAINMRDGIVDVAFGEGTRPTPRQLAKAVEDAGLTLVRIEVAP